MTLEQLDSFSSRIARKAATMRLKTLTKKAVKEFRKQGKEITFENVIKKFEGLEKLRSVGFTEEMIHETIRQEMIKCTT